MYHIEIYTLKISRFENRGYLYTEIRYKKFAKVRKLRFKFENHDSDRRILVYAVRHGLKIFIRKSNF